jgi:hypothetical protein
MQKIHIAHLYKIHDQADCATLQNIVRFLHYNGINAIPDSITERFIPFHIVIPSITLQQPNRMISGIENIAHYLEQETGIADLINKATVFAKNNPNYRCRQ